MIRDRVIELRRVPVRDLRPNPQNWRRHPPAQAAALRGALKEIGYADALLARETPEGLELIDGHLRAETTPNTVVPVLVLDVTAEEADKLLATLDPLAALAETDQEALDKLLEGVEIDSEALQSLLDDLGKRTTNDWAEREDSVPDLSEEPTTKPGDVWVLGPHRLLCGDATNADDVKRVMDGHKAALFHTDPPYLVDYVGSDRPSHGKDWSEVYREVDIADAERFFRTVFTAAIEVLEPDAAWYCWHAHKRAALIESVWAELGVLNHQQIIWVKPSILHGYAYYPWQHEPCLMGWRKGHKPYLRAVHGEMTRKEWDAMAMKDEIKAALREVIAKEANPRGAYALGEVAQGSVRYWWLQPSPKEAGFVVGLGCVGPGRVGYLFTDKDGKPVAAEGEVVFAAPDIKGLKPPKGAEALRLWHREGEAVTAVVVYRDKSNKE